MIIDEDVYLAHYGILRKSGRYPWGSGGTQSARNQTFLTTIENLKKEGKSEAEIAKGFGLTTTQLRAVKTIARSEQQQEKIAQAQRLKDKGYGPVAIGRRMGIPESTVRSLLAPGAKDKLDVLKATSSMLKDQVDKHKYIDIGLGVENNLGITQTKLKTAVAMLQEQGYTVHTIPIRQLGTGNFTPRKVLAGPGVTRDEVYRNRGNIKLITTHTDDGGRSYPKENEIHAPLSVSSKRIGIKYREDGGADADGVIELRRGVDDISLGNSHYAQVRIAVDGTHYLKGMAVHKDDMPEGVDILFNTSKSNTGNKKDAMKPLERNVEGKIDPMNPFGAQIKRQKGALNIINEEGDWTTWSRNLPSQFLSKQNPVFAQSQLNLTYERRRKELDDIMQLTNPAVRKKLLQSYSDSVDSAAIHLKAAAIPRQATKIILPVPHMKEDEIYAPTFRNGDVVALVRFPHGGTFEIPQLKVNNKSTNARKLLGSATRDAVGIHPKVAERLSGADFDGDTVLVIPNNKGVIKSTPALEGLKGFDPKRAFPAYPGMVPITKVRKEQEMGNVSNLITDMSVRGAHPDEITRAVRHSMVVIDSEKHNLDYKGSAKANGIPALKAKYQGIPSGARFPERAGASTLISKSGLSTKVRVPHRRGRPASKGGPIDPATGKKVYEYTGRTYIDKHGKRRTKEIQVPLLGEYDDAHQLSSHTRIEEIYADHSNRLKALGNQARKEIVATKPIPYSPSAKTAYSKEVESLNAKLNNALKNAPLERQAQALAATLVSQKRAAFPNMDKDDLRKVRYQALTEARKRTGAGKAHIKPTQEEWNAIQAGAFSDHKLNQILDNSDLDTIKMLATPKVSKLMSPVKKQRAMIMLESGYTQAEVAEALGVSVSTLNASVNE